MAFWNGRLAKMVLGCGIVLTVSVGAYIFVPRQSGEAVPIHLMPEVGESYVASLEDIRFAEMQMWAVVIDMDRFIGWFADETDLMRKASVRANKDLREVGRYLKALQLNGELTGLRDMQLAILRAMAKYYGGIESRSDADCTAMMADINALYAKYAEKLAVMTKGTVPGEEALEACMPAAWEPNDKNWDMSDAEMEKEINAMEQILDSGQYSPTLVETFADWRMRTQILFYGISNMSEIPNWKYNLKRHAAVLTIREYLKAHPSDKWAARQAELLLWLPNIGRGGPFGNDALSYITEPNET